MSASASASGSTATATATATRPPSLGPRWGWATQALEWQQKGDDEEGGGGHAAPGMLRWDLEDVGKMMRSQIVAKDVKGKLGVRTHEKCFKGADAVNWMVSTGTAEDRDEALLLGNAMLAYGIFSERTHEHTFRDKPYLYRFAVDDFDKIAQTTGQKVKVATSDYDFLCQAAERMRSELQHLTVHLGGSFPGAMCVGWLKQAGLVNTEQDAVDLGNALMRVGLIHHAHRRRVFEPTKELYRFSLDAFDRLLNRRRLSLGVMRGTTPRHRSSLGESLRRLSSPSAVQSQPVTTSSSEGDLAVEGLSPPPSPAAPRSPAVTPGGGRGHLSRREALSRFFSSPHRHFHDAAAEFGQGASQATQDSYPEDEDQEHLSVNDLYVSGPSCSGIKDISHSPTSCATLPNTPAAPQLCSGNSTEMVASLTLKGGSFRGGSDATPVKSAHRVGQHEMPSPVTVTSDLFVILQSLAALFPRPPTHDPDLLAPPPPELSPKSLRWAGHARRQTMKI